LAALQPSIPRAWLRLARCRQSPKLAKLRRAEGLAGRGADRVCRLIDSLPTGRALALAAALLVSADAAAQPAAMARARPVGSASIKRQTRSAPLPAKASACRGVGQLRALPAAGKPQPSGGKLGTLGCRSAKPHTAHGWRVAPFCMTLLFARLPGSNPNRSRWRSTRRGHL